MRSLLALRLLALGLIFTCACGLQANEPTLNMDFADGKIPSMLNMGNKASRWKVVDHKLVNPDVQKNDTFRIAVDKADAITVTADVNLLKTHEKGGFWGIALVMKNKTRLQVFNQSNYLRYYVRKQGDKLKPKNFAALPHTSWERAKITMVLQGEKLFASADGGKQFELAVENSGIDYIEFQAYQAQVQINSLAITGPVVKASAQSKSNEHLKSQLDVIEKIARPTVPNAYVILYIGDSITRHGFSKGTIAKLGWDHLAGMAATQESKDYAHLFATSVQKLLPAKKVIPMFHTMGGSGAVAHRLSKIDAFSNLGADVVVIQLGEHEKQHNGMDALQTKFTQLIAKMQAWKKKPLILCVGVWNPSGKGKNTQYGGWAEQVQKTMSGVCQSLGVPYASMEPHALNPANSGWGTSHGVKWHPNDAGMQAYAGELIRMYEQVKNK